MGLKPRDAAEAFEKELHKEFEDFQIRGEWFEQGEFPWHALREIESVSRKRKGTVFRFRDGG